MSKPIDNWDIVNKDSIDYQIGYTTGYNRGYDDGHSDGYLKGKENKEKIQLERKNKYKKK